MKTFLTAWIGTLILGWFILGLFESLFGGTGLLLLGVTAIALLISVLASLATELEELRKRVAKLEHPQETEEEDG